METATSQESQETLFGDRQSIKDLYIGEKHNFIRNGLFIGHFHVSYFLNIRSVFICAPIRKTCSVFGGGELSDSLKVKGLFSIHCGRR